MISINDDNKKDRKDNKYWERKAKFRDHPFPTKLVPIHKLNHLEYKWSRHQDIIESESL